MSLNQEPVSLIMSPDTGKTYTALLVCMAVFAAVTGALRVFLPGMPWGWMAVMAVTVALSLWAYAHAGGSTRCGVVVTGIAATLLGAGVVANVWYYTVQAGGTDAAPVLLNSDSMRFWRDTADFMREPGEFFGHVSTYAYVLAALFGITGPSVSACCILSMAMILTSLVQLSSVARRLGLSPGQSTLAMAVMAAVCYWLSMGCVLLKDAWVICAMVLAMRGMTGRCPTWHLAVAVVMLYFGRPAFLGMVMMGLVITAFPLTGAGVRRTVVCRLIWIAAVAALWYGLATLLDAPKVVEYGAVQTSIQDELTDTSHFAYYRIFGDIGSLPLWRKLLMTPVAACVQFFIPFPWNWCRDLVFGPTFVYAHFAYPWYLFGAAVIYFFGATVSRLRTHRLSALRLRVSLFALWGLCCWLVPCVLYGGTVSRYGLPALAMMAPAVAYTLTGCRRRSSFVIWIIVFAVITAAVLIVAYRMQMSAMNGPNPLK